MPFLHGFRRIIFEYQPLVDAILGALGIQDPERQEPLDRPSYVASEESRLHVLRELLEKKAHSPFYQEGVSNALLKMAELGLTQAAAILLRSGANLNFEDPVTYYTALHIAVLRNQPDMVELLVRHGADINRRDRGRRLCCMRWPAAMGSKCTTRTTSGSCWREEQTSRPPPKTGTLCLPASSSCLGRPWAGTRRRPR
ncbi:ankyrin repeat and SOCS box protein 6 isoform X2 [Heterocephalus glaber]|uniref:Ankyrin repeat and SOCS box protein 6 isoform X2 n=1 Tax=Heterocephalus glaber TaxID=10181 RepID=A0AAX6PCP4_HETGA|nr:ankyrin repeat and SOCS box protein 6 isoform X2 [Heterocephalus glaber]